MTEEGDLIPVRLHPFTHQVGGHSTMLKLDETTVCKPLIDREHLFYKSLPDELTEFVPRYKGSLSVEFEWTPAGDLQITGYLPRAAKVASPSCQSNGVASVTPADDDGEPQDGRGSIVGTSMPAGSQDPVAAAVAASIGSASSATHFDDIYRISLESGRLVIHDDTIGNYDNPQGKLKNEVYFSKSIANLLNAGQRHSFILLENLVARHRRPCILDLKMGTRQHGDTDNALKIQLKLGRCQETTSASLGFRICGMQVYNRVMRKYINKDKYYGRQLTADNMSSVLRQFLHSGLEFRSDVRAQLVDKLARFRDVVQRLSTYRFYSTSLLLIYDGGDDDGDDYAASNGGVPNSCGPSVSSANAAAAATAAGVVDLAEVAVNGQASAIDGAAISVHQALPFCAANGESVGAADAGTGNADCIGVRGTTRLSPPPVLLSASQQQQQCSSEHIALGDSSASTAAAAVEPSQQSSVAASATASLAVSNPGPGDAPDSRPLDATMPKADMRIIDFAHVTFKGFGTDSLVHDGPDSGYLFGLKNLTQLLANLEGDGETDVNGALHL